MLGEVMNLLEAEPNASENSPVESLTRVRDTIALRDHEQLAVLVSTGKANPALITTKHMNFPNSEASPAPVSEQSLPKAEQSPTIDDQQPAE